MRKPSLILVVDDSPADALLLSRSISKSGFGVLTAHNGRDAVRLATEKQPDLILLDMTMPGMDGIATCRELKRDAATESIPIIFVTGHSDSRHIVSAFAAGGSDYVTKPIRIDEIMARLSVQLRLREAEQNLVSRNQDLQALAKQLADTNEVIAQQSRVDGLTKLLNRRAWDDAARMEHERSSRYSRPYCILMMDVDYFKSYNDSLGHPEGDRCLQQVAEMIGKTCRTSDFVARYGGEEFVVLAPETSAEAGVQLAERIRHGVWGLSMRHPGSPAGRVTVSIGVAGNQEGPLDAVLKCADSFLYRAKNGGRNLVCSRRATVLAPLRIDDRREPPGPATDASMAREHAPMILVVEDNRPNRMVYRACLEKEGYRVAEVENGEAALAAVSAHTPDLILMDVMMPVMDGIECTRRLKADPKSRDIPVIIVSARDDTASVLAGLDAGADEYVPKPVRSTELIARVRSMVRLGGERRDLLRSYGLRAEQIRFLTILVDFCRTVANAATSAKVFEHLVETVGEITCSRRVSVVAPDHERKHFTIVSAAGLDPQLVRSVKVPIADGIAGRVFATREPLIVNTLAPGETNWPDSKLEPYVSVPLLAAPIGTSAQVLGVLNVTDRMGNRPFEGRELEYVELVVGIAASALHTIRNRQARDDARDMIINALARLAEHRDSDTGRHVERVTEYSCILAETLRRSEHFATIDEAFIRQLGHAVPLHDIGKVAIPDRVLLKPGKLSLEEMAVMRTHVDIGAETLRPLITKVPDANSLKMALDIIQAHHEWYDGSGYPQGLKGEAIPLSARIVAVADVYDAVTTNRVYREAMSPREAERIICQASGTQFDPEVVEAFLTARDQFQELGRRMADDAKLPQTERGATPVQPEAVGLRGAAPPVRQAAVITKCL